ncbi:endonuclease/exonuclease/phosphatase family protein [Trifolium medium]|uniref:Endonuclease/exonuclease/phosphatase family protein n=1 Tax=Trifolium medium TaxID=97028 RepID=A0A392N7D9_9FABA|nr:endonuclease/exonuclease/phosphatase family protein [Trifolium medium]
MQGNEHLAAADIRDIGDVIGVKFKDAPANRFNVLAGARSGKPRVDRELVKEGGGNEGGVGVFNEVNLLECEGSGWGRKAEGGASPFEFSYRPSVGASGGLLTMWDPSEVEVWSSVSREHTLVCHGRFRSSNEDFVVVNVYAPCDPGAKQRLWDSLSARLQSLVGSRVCVCGDFNAVRCEEERRSLRAGPRASDHIPFNTFIEDNNLLDFPLSGRKFTWYKGDGLSMSRLDRFLVSEEWCLTWPNCIQVALLRGLSDHCPLVLVASEDNWGPRPVRMLKCWRDIPGYHLFVREKWVSLQVAGWGGFVLKEKLRMIKEALK